MAQSAELRLDEEHRYWLGEIRLPGVTGVLDACGLVSSFAKQERARLRGTLVHVACRYLMEGRLNWATIPQIMGYVVSCDRWLQQTKFEIRGCEVMRHHPELLYAGTWDFEGLHERLGYMIIDLKSGAPEDWHKYQTAGYAGLHGKSPRRGALYLQEDGTCAKFRFHNESVDWHKFLACLTVARLQEAA